MTTQLTRRNMLKRTCGIALGGAAAAATGLTLKDAVAQPVTGTGIPVTGAGLVDGVLNGVTATLDRANDVIVLAGTLTGILDGTALTATPFTAVIENIFDSEERCDILFLELGPLDLNLLGLVVQLDTVVLDVFAVPGAGNLLGNLLCAVAGLLDNPGGSLSGITNLLNRIFRIFG